MTQSAPGPPVAGDEITRVRLAASPASAPELLTALAADKTITVRAAVALNTATPTGADHLLARDGDERIRNLLARRLATFVASSQSTESAEQYRQAADVLDVLAGDASARVRTTITDSVKESPQAPRKLILHLAHDRIVRVSEPVIRCSPVLTTEDLLQLLAAAPNYIAATAAASRIGLNDTLSEVIASGTDAAAISALLANHSAAIGESTLKKLVARAAGQAEWKELLSQRPNLPPVLSELLTGRTQVRAPTVDEALWEARQMAHRGELDEAAVLTAVQRGEVRMVTALLAVAADVPVAMVDRAATLRNATALVSLVWRAGFSMRTVGPVQILLARTLPGQVLRPGPGGAFPLAKEEMCWQINLLKSMLR